MNNKIKEKFHIYEQKTRMITMKLDKLGEWRRTHFTSDLTPELIGETVKIAGWVQRIRKLGALTFIILQDNKRRNTAHAQKGGSP